MLATSAWMACPVRASVSCGPTFASMTASVTSSPAKEPSAGGWGLGEVICLCACRKECLRLQVFVRPVLHQLTSFSNRAAAAAGGQFFSH